MSYRMILNETSYFGVGSINAIVDEVKKRGFKKALVVTDHDLIQFNVATKVLDILDSAGLPYQIFDKVIPNPTIDIVQQGVEAFRQAGADYLVAIGGGSPQDTCKAVGIIISNPEFADVRSLEGGADTQNAAVPMIAIPTTAGTAAEVTINYVITDVENRRKFVCYDPHAIPVVAIIDADMMASMPPSLKAATGVDALTHAIEGYITKGAWELTDTLHLKAIEMIGRSLRGSIQGIDQDAEGMAVGQYIAGMGFSNVGLGLVHGMAHPLGAFYGTPHGVANAVLLPHIMAYNAEFTGDKYRQIAQALGNTQAMVMPIEEARQAAVEAVEQLNRDVNIPVRLRDIGMKYEDIDALAVAAMADICTGGNPRDTCIEEIKVLYRQLY
ncbi:MULTISPECIES: lactaldehyde reductase [Citrobacter]|uniref:Lactaldehyde reductase n=1 Tax=Citrobacter meridianamericanus TaxID=2894201 RepID=A0ABT1B1J5_9ENTR|nr:MULTISPECIES: lactaldehyde reductase [Citrobacter]HCW0180558.1 lactaldehyde reductase [Citrobacter freundii]MBP8543243.1 lactaldehyde reductase [Citrobacter sp. On2M]MBW5273988.1 lactaldehyde reductase [Citrobacter sp. On28M]MCO5779755.1 lactaldehyde reductase [Citrobacter meridianamericanus]MDM2745851.1 lactaldehyde reductase [Citrobacter sp. Cu231]